MPKINLNVRIFFITVKVEKTKREMSLKWLCHILCNVRNVLLEAGGDC